MQEDRNLSPATVLSRCSSVRPFLIQLLDGRQSLEKITVSDVDLLLAQKVNEEQYARRSVRDYASSLRSFFRYAFRLATKVAKLRGNYGFDESMNDSGGSREHCRQNASSERVRSASAFKLDIGAAI
jgi:hypothetical protein